MTKEERQKYCKGVCSDEYIATGVPRFGQNNLTAEQIEEADALCKEIEAKTAEMVRRDILPKEKAEKTFDELISKLKQNSISKNEARKIAHSELMEYLETTSFGGTMVDKYFQIVNLCRSNKRSRKEKK